MKILLAEDDALARFMMAEMLDELNCDFDTCADGDEAVSMLTQGSGQYGLVLMDVHMPVRTGIEATQIIRSTKADDLSDIPIIAVTADHSWQNPERAAEVGFTDVLPKPVSIAKLKQHIERAQGDASA